MKKILGILMIVCGAILGLYVGIWFCFIGGIIGLAHAASNMIQTGSVDGFLIAVNIAKLVFAGLAAWLSAAILIFPGWVLCSKGGNP